MRNLFGPRMWKITLRTGGTERTIFLGNEELARESFDRTCRYQAKPDRIVELLDPRGIPILLVRQ